MINGGDQDFSDGSYLPRILSLGCGASQFAILFWQLANQHQPTGANQLEALDGVFRVFLVGMTGLLPLVVGSGLGLGAGHFRTKCIVCNLGCWLAAIALSMLL